MPLTRHHIRCVSLVAGLATCTIAAANAGAGPVQSIDVANSTIKISVLKEGLFAFAADNHVIDVPIASGSFDDATKSVAISINASKLQVIDTNLPPNRRAQVQANMTGPQVLDVAHYPKIEFRSTTIATNVADAWQVTGDLTFHGQTHPLTFAVTKVDATHFRGSATVRQSTFGITPIRIAGGTVRVKDDVKVDFEIVL